MIFGAPITCAMVPETIVSLAFIVEGGGVVFHVSEPDGQEVSKHLLGMNVLHRRETSTIKGFDVETTLKTVTSLNKEARLLKFHFS